MWVWGCLDLMNSLLNPDFTAKRIHGLIAQIVITGPADVTARRELSYISDFLDPNHAVV